MSGLPADSRSPRASSTPSRYLRRMAGSGVYQVPLRLQALPPFCRRAPMARRGLFAYGIHRNAMLPYYQRPRRASSAALLTSSPLEEIFA